MNTHFHPHRDLNGLVRRLLILHFVFVFVPFVVVAAPSLQVNDEVQLTRDTPLLFGDKPLRQGTAGESFRVLAYKGNLKKVFIAAQDATGKTIALNVAEDSVALPPPDVAKVQADVRVAVSNQQFLVADQIVERALRAKPGDPNLQSLRLALLAISKNAGQLAQAHDRQQSTRDEIKRLHRNADILDHPNALDANDHSGHQRAAAIRSEAMRLEDQAKAALSELQTNYDATVAAVGAIASSSKSGNSVQPGLPMTAEQAKLQQEGQRANDLVNSQRLQNWRDRKREWTEDPETVPAGVTSANPTYQETIDFINTRLKGRLKVWFGRHHDKLIVQFTERYDGRDDQLCVLEPSALTPEVKRFATERGIYSIQLESSSNEHAIEYPLFSDGKRFSHSVRFECADEIDAEKLARAFSHLIDMFGGKKDVF